MKVYTPDSHVRSDYEMTLRIKGQEKHKTADHVLYETTQVRERYDHVLSFVFLRGDVYQCRECFAYHFVVIFCSFLSLSSFPFYR